MRSDLVYRKFISFLPVKVYAMLKVMYKQEQTTKAFIDMKLKRF